MTGSVEAVINSLKGMINRNGPHYLSDKPYQVYEELKESGITDRKTAGAILLFLVNGMMILIHCVKRFKRSAALTRKWQKN